MVLLWLLPVVIVLIQSLFPSIHGRKNRSGSTHSHLLYLFIHVCNGRAVSGV